MEPTPLRLNLASAPALVRDGVRQPLRSRDAALLAWLAIEGPTSRARLAALIWPGSSEHAARNLLRQRLFALRRQCGVDLVDGQQTVRLADGVAHDLAGAERVLAGVEPVWGEELQAWLDAQAGLRQRQRRDALAAEADAAEAASDWSAALALAQALLAIEPLTEAAHQRVMRLHYLAGDRAAALLAFDHCERVLKDDVGTRPDATTLALLQTLQHVDPGPVHRGGVPASVLRPPRRIGRDAEWQALEAAWAEGRVAIVTGEGGLGKSRLLDDFVAAHGAATGSAIAVRARPGDALLPYSALGRFLRALVARPGIALSESEAERQSGVAERPPQTGPIKAQSTDMAPAMASICNAEWGGLSGTSGHVRSPLSLSVRAELARVLPELGSIAAPSGTDRTRFVNAVELVLERAVEGGLATVVIDDLHLADDASVELFVQLAGAGLLRWLIALRDAEMRPGPRARVGELMRARPVASMLLRPLTAAESRELVASLGLAGWGDAQRATGLHRRVGGNPMYLLETLREALFEPAPVLSGGFAATPTTAPGVGRLILRRIEALSAPAVKLARCAAIAGQDFTPRLAAAVLQVSALDLADAWNELERAQVLQDGNFCHDLIQEAALASVPQAIAGELHGQVAQVLEAAKCMPARVAFHWLAAAQPLRAAPLLHAAGTSSVARFRHLEAAQAFEQAAAIFEQAGRCREAFDAWFAAGDAAGALGDRVGMERCLLRFERLAQTDRDHAMAIVLRCSLDFAAGRFDDVLANAVLGLAAARRAGDAEAQSELLYLTGIVHWERRQIAQAASHVEAALVLRRGIDPATSRIEHVPTLVTMTQAFGAMLGAGGRFADAERTVLEAVRIADEARSPALVLGSAAEMTLRRLEAGDVAGALAWAERGAAGAAAREAHADDRTRFELNRLNTVVCAGRWGEALTLVGDLLPRLPKLGNFASDGAVRCALFQAAVGRRDLALRTLHGEAAQRFVTPVQELSWALAALALGLPGDPAGILDRIVALEDIALRTRLLVRLAPHGKPPALLPAVSLAAATVRDAGAPGLWLSLQSAIAALLAAAGRDREAAAAAGLAWERHAAGVVPSHFIADMAADLARGLLHDPATARRIVMRGQAWLRDAVATLPDGWRHNAAARSPLRERLQLAARELGDAPAGD